MPLTLGTWFSQVDVFLSEDLVIGLGGLVKAMDVVWTLVGEYTRAVSAMWLSLVSFLLHVSEEPCLSPDLSSSRVEIQNQTSFCSSPAVFHLWQNCLDLASMPCIGEVDDTAWRQIDLLLGFLRAWLFSDKLPDEVSSRMSLLHSWTPSLL